MRERVCHAANSLTLGDERPTRCMPMRQRHPSAQTLATRLLHLFENTDLFRETLLLCAVLVAVKISGHPLGHNDASRLATIESLVERGTFCIDGSRYSTIDKIPTPSGSVSNKSQLFSVILSGAYYVLHKAGLTFGRFEDIAIRSLILVGVSIPFLATIAGLRLLLLSRKIATSTRNVTLFFFALGSLNTAYASTLNNHVPAAAAATWAIALLFRNNEGCASTSKGKLFASGFLFGLSIAIDQVAGFLTVPIALLVLLRFRRSDALTFGLVCAVPCIVGIAVQFGSTGTFFPAFRPEWIRDMGDSYWSHPIGIDAKEDPVWIKCVNYTIGHHGLFLVCPVIVSGIVYSFRRGKEPSKDDGVLCCGSFLTILGVVLFGARYGGVCYGPRFMIVIVPLLFLFVGMALDRLTTWRGKGVYHLLGLAGVVQSSILCRNPWQFPAAAELYSLLGIDALDTRF